MKRTITLFLLFMITLSSALVAVGIDLYARHELDSSMRREIEAVHTQLRNKTTMFDIVIGNIEREVTNHAAAALPRLAADVEAVGDASSISLAVLRRLAERHGFDEVYLVGRDGVIFNTTYIPDKGLGLYSLSESYKNFLLGVFGNGKAVSGRITVSSRTGVLNKYSFFGTLDGNLIVEASTDIRRYIERVHGQRFNTFLFHDFFVDSVETNAYIHDLDIFLLNNADRWSLTTAGAKLPEDVAVELLSGRESAERTEGNLLSVYSTFRLAEGSAEYSERFVTKVVYDLGGLDRFTLQIALRSLAVLAGVVFLTFLSSSYLLNERLIKRIRRITHGLARIARGDYADTIEVQGTDEITDIAQSINAMQREIVSRERELRNANELLEQRVAERTCELAESERLLAFHVHQTPLAYMRLDRELRVQEWNRAAEDVFGWRREEAMGKSVLDIAVPEQGRASLERALRSVLSGAGERQTSCGCMAREGRDLELEWHNTPLLDPCGRVVGLACLAQDVTERSRLEALRRDVERLSRHDMRDALSIVVCGPQLVREGGAVSAEQEQVLALMEETGGRLLTLTSSSLDLFKMEAGTYTLIPAPVDLASVARKVARELSALASGLGVSVEISLNGEPLGPSGSLIAPGEELLVHSMLFNLVKNAVEASKPGGRVRLGLARENGFVTMAVHNDGEVAPDMKDRFFEKYATSGKQGGTGLGTYMARLAARTHGGDIGMESSSAQGTTVTVRLPAPM